MARDGRQKFANLDYGSATQAGDADQGQAEGAGSVNDGGQSGAGDADGADGGQEEAKYTDADLDTIIQRRLARERQKMEREIRDSIERESQDAETEAEKLKGMTELQRAQHEARKLRAENESLKARQNLAEQMAVARRELGEAGISLGDDLLSMFVSPEAEKTGAAIDQLKELWPKAVNEAVRRELKRTPPPAERHGGSSKSYGTRAAEKYNRKMNGGK